MNAFTKLAIVIASIGALNWGIVGLFDVNPLSALGLDGPFLRAIYVLVGVFGLLALMLLPRVPPRYDFGHRQS